MNPIRRNMLQAQARRAGLVAANGQCSVPGAGRPWVKAGSQCGRPGTALSGCRAFGLLVAPQRGVAPVPRKQVGMGAFFGHAAILEHDNPVGIGHR